MKQILLHIGYHKTGTTWLQKEIFDKEQLGLSPLLDSRNKNNAILSKSITPFLYGAHDLDFRASQMRDHIENYCTSQTGKMPVISDERLSGNPHGGGRDSAAIAERLREVFPQAKILITIREQISVILSCYHQYLKRGGCRSLKEYLTPRQAPEGDFFTQSHFHYHRLVELYQNYFKPENVLVAPFESYKSEKNFFIQQLGDFVGYSGSMPDIENSAHNKTPSYIGASYTRLLGPLIARDPLNGYSPLAPPLSPGHGKHALRLMRKPFDILPDKWEKAFKDKQMTQIKESINLEEIAKSNAKLIEQTNLQLGQYGYLLP